MLHSVFSSFTLTVSSGCKEKDMSMKMNEPRNIKGVISYKRSFGDLNDTHLSAAKRIGIRPLASRTEAEGLGGKLVEVAPCERYAMDSLTHSIPFGAESRCITGYYRSQFS